jgi:hypothetical protein
MKTNRDVLRLMTTRPRSHIAGIDDAKDNELGVVGMAPDARMWAVKMCDAGCA